MVARVPPVLKTQVIDDCDVTHSRRDCHAQLRIKKPTKAKATIFTAFVTDSGNRNFPLASVLGIAFLFRKTPAVLFSHSPRRTHALNLRFLACRCNPHTSRSYSIHELNRRGQH